VARAGAKGVEKKRLGANHAEREPGKGGGGRGSCWTMKTNLPEKRRAENHAGKRLLGGQKKSQPKPGRDHNWMQALTGAGCGEKGRARRQETKAKLARARYKNNSLWKKKPAARKGIWGSGARRGGERKKPSNSTNDNGGRGFVGTGKKGQRR